MWLLVAKDEKHAYRIREASRSSSKGRHVVVLDPSWTVPAGDGPKGRKKFWHVAAEWGLLGDPGYTEEELKRKYGWFPRV